MENIENVKRATSIEEVTVKELLEYLESKRKDCVKEIYWEKENPFEKSFHCFNCIKILRDTEEEYVLDLIECLAHTIDDDEGILLNQLGQIHLQEYLEEYVDKYINSCEESGESGESEIEIWDAIDTLRKMDPDFVFDEDDENNLQRILFFMENGEEEYKKEYMEDEEQ